FIVYNEKDGLTNNVVFKIFEDSKGRIWFVPFSLQLCYFKNDKIQKYQFNHKIPEFNVTPYLMDFHVDSDDNVFVGIRYEGRIIIDNQGTVDLSRNTSHFSDDSIPLVKQDTGNMDIEFREGEPLLTNRSKNRIVNEAIVTVDLLDTVYQMMQYPHGAENLLNFLVKSPIHNSIYFNHGTSIYSIDLNTKILKKVRTMDNLIVSLYADTTGLWISLKSHHTVLVDYSTGQTLLPPILENYSVTSITIDNAGGYWFTTLENGVFYSSSLNSFIYSTAVGLDDNFIT